MSFKQDHHSIIHYIRFYQQSDVSVRYRSLYAVLSPFISFCLQSTTEESKGEKKSDQPPQAKKPKVKTKVLELPVENSPQWQLADDMLNLFVENEVTKLPFYLHPYGGVQSPQSLIELFAG